MIPAPSCLGKLPLHGDFLRIRVNQVQKAKLDKWFAALGKAVSPVKPAKSEDAVVAESVSVIEPVYPWCFVMRGSLLGASNQLVVIGVLFDSFDKIGRRYPFVMYQLVPKRWLINQLKAPNHWLQWLQQFAKSCHQKGSAEVDAMLNQLWAIYKPQLIDYFKAHTYAQRQFMSKQAERLLQSWQTSQLKIDDIGVINPPWANWPHSLNMKKQASIWWQLDDAGRYLNCVEHNTLDKTLLEQLLGRS
jgi:type VI secretion system ImpM family protein